MKYLKQFLIGSSFPVFIIHFLSVRFYRSKKNYKYEDYTLIAPPYLGLLNVLFFYLSQKYDWSMEIRFKKLSTYGSIFMMFLSYINKTYKFNQDEWIKYFISIYLIYYFTWNYIVYNIEKNLE